MALSLRSARPRLMADYGSGARADLALRIAELAAHDEAAARAGAAQSDLVTACREAEEEAEAAEAALCRAKFGVNIIAGLDGKIDGPPLSAQEARVKKQAALDKHEAATAALASLRERQKNEVWKRDSLAAGVKRAAAAVLRETPDVKGMYAKLDRLQREFLTTVGDFVFLVQANVVATRDDDDVSPLKTAEAASAAHRARILWGQPWSNWEPDAARLMGAERWKTALALLQTDANAPLPEGISS